MNDWKPKPGDVGLHEDYGYRSMYVASCYITEHKRDGGGCWHNESSFSDPPESPRRPLVVIDPEDRAAVERLMATYRAQPGWYAGNQRETEDCMQAALREFAAPKPPRPPADVAAAVTDCRDNTWRLLADGDWVCVDGPDRGEYLNWDRLAADRGPLEVRP